MEDRLWVEGVPYIASETPGSLDLGKRIELNFEMMKAIADYKFL
jgi:hypothetical protein